ncbi:MAG: dihydropteroate synthase [Clostridiales bacterium]|nr:dihydropteroate synthase [Clostridiales bacterium]
MNFRELLENNEFVFLDGGMGTMLQERGLEIGGIPEELNIKNSKMIEEIHREYVEAGANILYTNTFGANRFKLENIDYSVDEIIKSAISNAKKATYGTKTLVAQDIGPIGQLLEPTGTLSFNEAYDVFKEQVIAGEDSDLIILETMTDLYELKAGLLAVKENSNKPVICTMTFEENLRTFTGCEISSMALTLEGLGADAIGLNCSLGPKELEPVVAELSRWTRLPIVIKPNAGLPDPETNMYNVTPSEFSQYMKNLVKYGVKIFGGCCGTTPDFIRETIKALSDVKHVKLSPEIPAAVCSPNKTVIINQPRIIGERINPTGKKVFKEALLKNDIDYILGQAIEQTGAGAEILDVNVGLPGIDEEKMMISAVKAIQGITDAPLQIDSTIPEVLESALRIYNGKPIVNSVNGEEKSLKAVLPLVKKYGASVVGLTLDENGIPKKAEDRFAIAKRILDRALELGIPKENVFIDCLTLTASAEQDGVMETLNALNRVKNELGLKTVLGVSNISFGLPNRELINSNFLTMAMTMGLDLPIINPNISAMAGAVRSYRLLTGSDKNSLEFIAEYGGDTPKTIAKITSKADITLDYAIENGLKNDGARITEKLLEETDSMIIVNEMLIPALDKAGDEFEKGKIFLPQLIQAASVAQACFEVIKANLAKNSAEQISKGKIILATVKGDIHDIGKNIVKVLLENYGYDVIDLGRDVDYQVVVNSAIENDVHLIGLSALMTTTLISMENTIKLIHENNIDCKIMVGGAVLTPEYAMKIGADFYAKDAKESCDIAKKVLG